MQHVALVAGPGDTALLRQLGEDGGTEGETVRNEDLAAAVAERERRGDVRWVWADTAAIYPRLLRAGVRVERCHDLALTETLLLARDGRPGEPVTLAAAWARARGEPVPAGTPAQREPAGRPGPRQAALFESQDPVLGDPAAALGAVAAVYASQVTRVAADQFPNRFALLVAAESAGGLAAAEMGFHGVPWRADAHDELLTGLLGPRPAAGMRPARLAELAARIGIAFGGRPVNPDSPAQLLRAFAADGIRIPSTRSAVLRETDHPAVPLLLEYKELARLHAAHGWAWLDEWVTDGRFRPEYVVGGVVSGRWATRGGGALQIPRVLRRAVVADPGWVLVVADAAQLEPRVLAALAGDRAFAAAAGTGDLYAALAGAFGGDRGKAKIALLSAMYGGASGEAVQLLAVLRRRFPLAARYVENAARAGEEGRVVRSRLGRTCPPPSAAWRGLTAVADDPAAGGEDRAGRTLRARGRFTRNFVVQASAADWATVLLAGLRRRLAAPAFSARTEATAGNGSVAGNGAAAWTVSGPGNGAAAATGSVAGNGSAAGGGAMAGSEPAAGDGAMAGTGATVGNAVTVGAAAGSGLAPRLVFFQHDEVIVHCPAGLADAVVAAVQDAADEAGRLLFGETQVRFPVTTAVVDCYADAK